MGYYRNYKLKTYKSFVRPDLDYGDVIYDQHYNNSFQQKLEQIHYNAVLAITSAIIVSSRLNFIKN